VGLKQGGSHTLVKTTVPRRFELLLIDVAKFVADRTRNELGTLREALEEGNHLRAHLPQNFLVALRDQAARASAKEARFIEGSRVEQELLECKDLHASLQVYSNLGVAEGVGGDLFTRQPEAQIDQMQAHDVVDIESEQLILLHLLGLLVVLHLSAHLSDRVGRADGESLLNMVEIAEFFHRLCLAFLARQFLDLPQVGKHRLWLLPLRHLVDVFEDQARSLVRHDGVGALESGEWRDIAPLISDA